MVLRAIAESFFKFEYNASGQINLPRALKFSVESVEHLLVNEGGEDDIDFNELINKMTIRRQRLAHNGVMPFSKNVNEDLWQDAVFHLILRAQAMLMFGMDEHLILRFLREVGQHNFGMAEQVIFKSA